MINLKKLSLTTAILILISGVAVTTAQTQSQLILTWQAYNYYPSDYPGKAAATPNSQLLISAEMLANNRFVNLNDATVTWYVDNKFFQRGLGLKQIVLNSSKLTGDRYLIRVAIQRNGEILEETTIIPLRSPQVIIDSSFPNNTVSGGRTITFQAVPYFFDIQSLGNLTFSWRINDQLTPQYNQNQVEVAVENPDFDDPRNLLNVNVTVRNTVNTLEFAEGGLKLLVERTLP